MTADPGLVWPPKGVEPAAPALRRSSAQLQPMEPLAPMGERLLAALGGVRDGMVALGAAAERAAAAVPQLPQGEQP